MKKLLALILLALPSIAAAHDFWLEPSTYRPAPNTAVAIRLRVGEPYEGDPVPRPEALLVFDAFTAEQKTRVEGDTGEEPAGVVTVKNRGLVLVAYHNSPGYVELTEDKLRQYLQDEGLERLAEVRKRSPYADQPWRELFSRCAKTLLWTGSGPATVFNKRVGMPLELIPEKNPYALKGGGTLPVQLLYRGKPLAGTRVVITPRRDPARKRMLRSDANGRVQVKLDAPGEWMINAVHIVPAAEGQRAQWESFWASLTFELPE